MAQLAELLKDVSQAPIAILDASIPFEKYTSLNLSVTNPDIAGIDMGNPETCQTYIDSVLASGGAQVAYGGYLEQRSLYANNPNFNFDGTAIRNIHLGVDFWTIAGTKVLAPLEGVVHSFKNNAMTGDYGPTIVLGHVVQGIPFYALYGHLSLTSLDGLFTGKQFQKGDVIGTLGTSDINVNYAPHLHFQIIQDIGTYQGDYPGVCTTKELEYYKENCPNPLFLLKV